jgi:hypothetical protein
VDYLRAAERVGLEISLASICRPGQEAAVGLLDGEIGLAGLQVVNLDARLVIAEQFRGQQGLERVRVKVVDGAVGGDGILENGKW